MHRQIEVVGIGSAVYDTLMVVPRFPAEDTKMRGTETKIQGGGPCATALAAAQKLGISTAYLGNLGEDPFGRFLRADLEHWGVCTDGVRMCPDCTSFHAVVLLSAENGSRTCIWNGGTVPDPAPDEVLGDILAGAKVLHLDGHMPDAALAAATFCKAHGIKVSYDAGGIYPGTESLLSCTDWLIPSEEFALKITGCSAAEDAAQALYRKHRPELVIVTQGKRGGILLDASGIRRYASYPVAAVDTNGCGDTFHGAFIAGKLRGLSNDDACRYAGAAAAIKATRLGARSAMPDDGECRAFLRTHGVQLP